MKTNELNELFTKFAASKKLKVSENGHFEGDKYISPKPYTISLKWADRRTGNKIAIVLNLPSGAISLLSDYLKMGEMKSFLQGSLIDIAGEIKRYRKAYK